MIWIFNWIYSTVPLIYNLGGDLQAVDNIMKMDLFCTIIKNSEILCKSHWCIQLSPSRLFIKFNCAVEFYSKRRCAILFPQRSSTSGFGCFVLIIQPVKQCFMRLSVWKLQSWCSSFPEISVMPAPPFFVALYLISIDTIIHDFVDCQFCILLHFVDANPTEHVFPRAVK